MDGTAVNAIRDIAQEAADTKIIGVGGRSYSTRELIPVKAPTPKEISIDTLTGVVDYLVGNPDKLDLSGIIVTVDGPTTVSVRSKLTDEFQQRHTYLAASWPDIGFRFGQFYEVESFIILLQAHFMDNRPASDMPEGMAADFLSDRAKILRLVGNITDGATRNYNDDGVTQQVTAKVGITRVEGVAVPNPVLLIPYRTFPEIVQPKSNFIFRMKAGEQKPGCALFEADGGRWKIEAVASIKQWLTGKLPEGVVVLA
jgi:hypothetical protein